MGEKGGDLAAWENRTGKVDTKTRIKTGNNQHLRAQVCTSAAVLCAAIWGINYGEPWVPRATLERLHASDLPRFLATIPSH